MNRQADADELNVELESLLASGIVEIQGKWRALTAIAAELRELPNPEFKSQLKAELLEEYSVSSREIAFEQVTGVAAFAEILPFSAAKDFRMFPADHRSFVVSFISHTALIMLIASGIWVGGRPMIKSIATTPMVTYFSAKGGGGGSGDHSPIPATKGTPPKMSEQQLAPATIVVRRLDPMLPVQPTVVGPPDVKLPQSDHIGDMISSNVVIPLECIGRWWRGRKWVRHWSRQRHGIGLWAWFGYRNRRRGIHHRTWNYSSQGDLRPRAGIFRRGSQNKTTGSSHTFADCRSTRTASRHTRGAFAGYGSGRKSCRRGEDVEVFARQEGRNSGSGASQH